MDSIIIQNVFERLEDYLPDKWKKMAFFAGYTKGSYGMKFFVRTDKGYIDCFNIPNVNQMQLMLLFQNINKDLANYRNTLSESECWTVFTMLVDSKGRVKTYFDYKDISDSFIEYQKEWEKKYLK